jgi:hypothetical protein
MKSHLTGPSATPAGRLSRRHVLQVTAATTVLVAALGRSGAWAGGTPAALEGWARDLVDLNQALTRREITVLDWQARVAQLNQSVSVPELVSYLDIDRLTRHFSYPSRLAEFADPLLPPHLMGQGRRTWFVRVFGLRRGGAIIPHVHNHMVSAHLVVSGCFHVRTHDRVQDLADAVVLRPSQDRITAMGDVITMSDQKDNQHWMVAEQDRSMTFDVGVVGLPASYRYAMTAEAYNMIYVDADRRPEQDGLVVAPRLTFEQCAKKYA